MTRKIASLQINAAEASNDQLLIARSNNLVFDSVANVLVAGNAITIEANGRISSTAAGGGNVTISTTPPTDKKIGDVWISDESGIQFTWVEDTDSSQWVELGTIGLQGPTGPTGASGNSFTTFSVAGQNNVVADSSDDTLTLVAGDNITLTTNTSNDSIIITSTASGGADPAQLYTYNLLFGGS